MWKLLVLILPILLTACVAPNPYAYTTELYHQMSDKQKDSIWYDEGQACEDLEGTKPETANHIACVRQRIKARDQYIKDYYIAEASATKISNHTSTYVTQKVEQEVEYDY